MTTNRTGPELFDSALAHRRDAVDMYDPGTAEQREQLDIGLLEAVNANTAMLRTIAGILATAAGVRDADLEGWNEVIPTTPQRTCWSRTDRRPECAERHTEDCDYTDPEPEPEHELLPVGTRVIVHPVRVVHQDGRVTYSGQPSTAKIVGYDTFRSKYQLNAEKFGGGYYDFVTWAFADNRVQPHPEQDTVVAEPTGPRIYVEHYHGKQGHVVEVSSMNGELMFLVQWYTPGSGPVWKTAANLTIIPADQVDRCPHGQTRDNCGSGENQCEPCLAAEDNVADTIERDMGLR